MKLLVFRRTALLSALLFLPALPTLAQTEVAPAAQTEAPPPPPGGFHRGGGIEHRVEMLQRDLDLTPAQTTQVKSVLEGERTRMEALRANAALSQDDRHSQMMAIHSDTSTKMHALLTPDQVTKYDALEARMREHRPGNGDAPPPSSPAGSGPQ